MEKKIVLERTNFQGIEEEQNRSVWTSRRIIFLVAASIVVVFSFWVSYNISQSTNQKIVAEFASIPPTLKDETVGAFSNNQIESDFNKAKKAFAEKNYAEAARLFKSALDATTTPSALNTRRSIEINLAHSLFQLKKYGDAVVLYRSAQRESDALLPLSVVESAQLKHFEVLALIGNNQISEAKKRLDLMDPSNIRLDDRLNSFWRF